MLGDEWKCWGSLGTEKTSDSVAPHLHADVAGIWFPMFPLFRSEARHMSVCAEQLVSCHWSLPCYSKALFQGLVHKWLWLSNRHVMSMMSDEVPGSNIPNIGESTSHIFLFTSLYHFYTQYRSLYYWHCSWVNLDEVNGCIHIAVFVKTTEQHCHCRSISNAIPLSFELLLELRSW